MQGVRTDVTNASGDYRFPGIPPGTYRLVYELAGFRQARQFAILQRDIG